MSAKTNWTTLQKIFLILCINLLLLFGLLTFYLVQDHWAWTNATNTILIYSIPFAVSVIYLGFLGFVERVKISQNQIVLYRWFFIKHRYEMKTTLIKKSANGYLLFNNEGRFLCSIWNQTSKTNLLDLSTSVDFPLHQLVPSVTVKIRSRIVLLFVLILSFVSIFLAKISVFWVLYYLVDMALLIYAGYEFLFAKRFRLILIDQEVKYHSLFKKEKRFLKKNVKYKKSIHKLDLFSGGVKLFCIPSSHYEEIGMVLSKLKVNS
ncbi:MAG: hypothetical protein AB7U79_00095 [Candidatus Izemoplasmatales bacterium]